MQKLSINVEFLFSPIILQFLHILQNISGHISNIWWRKYFLQERKQYFPFSLQFLYSFIGEFCLIILKRKMCFLTAKYRKMFRDSRHVMFQSQMLVYFELTFDGVPLSTLLHFRENILIILLCLKFHYLTSQIRLK